MLKQSGRGCGIIAESIASLPVSACVACFSRFSAVARERTIVWGQINRVKGNLLVFFVPARQLNVGNLPNLMIYVFFAP